MSDPCLVAMRGIVPSLNTPFTDDDKIDEPGLRREVDHVIAAGCVGILALAVAGEGAQLSPDEADRAGAIIVEHTAGRAPVILSVTADDYNERLRRTRHARAQQADGILCQVPAGMDRARRRELLSQVADAGPPLLMIQDLDWHGPGLEIDEVVDLFERVSTFRCLKIETAPAGPKYSRVLEATDGRLHVSGGWAVGQMIDALARNVHAFMPTGMEPLYAAIYRLYTAGEHDEARQRFEAVLPILTFSNQHIDISIRFFKQHRRAQGLFATECCRPPVPLLDAVQQREAQRLITLALSLEARSDVRHGSATHVL